MKSRSKNVFFGRSSHSQKVTRFLTARTLRVDDSLFFAEAVLVRIRPAAPSRSCSGSLSGVSFERLVTELFSRIRPTSNFSQQTTGSLSVDVDGFVTSLSASLRCAAPSSLSCPDFRFNFAQPLLNVANVVRTTDEDRFRALGVVIADRTSGESWQRRTLRTWTSGADFFKQAAGRNRRCLTKIGERSRAGDFVASKSADSHPSATKHC